MIPESQQPNNPFIDTAAHKTYTENDVAALLRLAGEMLKKQEMGTPVHLENRTETPSELPCGGMTDMAKERIKRRVLINGQIRWVTGSSEQEYADNLIRILAPEALETPGEKHLFEDYAKNWYEVFSKPNVSKTTAITYDRQLHLYIYPVLQGKYLEDITVADIQKVFNAMDSEEKKLTTASKAKTKMVLNMIFQQAVEENIIGRNPLTSKTLRIKGNPSQTTKPYTVEQMRYIVSQLPSIRNYKDRMFLSLLALHPLRLEEALGLRWKDIDLEKDLIHISSTVTHPDRNQGLFREMTKTDSSRRTIALVPQLKAFMVPGEADEFLVGDDKIQSYQLVKDMCKRIRNDIGFEESITPRRFRTTVLTDIYDATKDIKQTQAAAGHTTAAMTLKHYVKGREEKADTASAIAKVYGLPSAM